MNKHSIQNTCKHFQVLYFISFPLSSFFLTFPPEKPLFRLHMNVMMQFISLTLTLFSKNKLKHRHHSIKKSLFGAEVSKSKLYMLVKCMLLKSYFEYEGWCLNGLLTICGLLRISTAVSLSFGSCRSIFFTSSFAPLDMEGQGSDEKSTCPRRTASNIPCSFSAKKEI